MKKFTTKLLTAALAATVALSFGACSLDDHTDSALQLAKDAYAAQVKAVQTLKDDENARGVNYVASSFDEKMTLIDAALASFSAEGKTADELNAQANLISGFIASIKTSDEAIDERIENAIKALKLYKVYSSSDPDKKFYPDETHKEGDIVYVDDTGDVVEKDAPNAKPFADKGVDEILYDRETNKATFIVNKDSTNQPLIDFIGTDVITIFEKDFRDLELIQINLMVQQNGAAEKTPYALKLTADNANGMYLAATLLAVCVGYDQTLYETFTQEDGLSKMLQFVKEMKDKDFSAIIGTGCSATVTFNHKDDEGNVEYHKAVDFSVEFKLAE